MCVSIWVNYNNSLAWNKAILDDSAFSPWFQWGRSEVVIICPDLCVYLYIYIYTGTFWMFWGHPFSFGKRFGLKDSDVVSCCICGSTMLKEYPGWWFQHLWKIWKSVRVIIPNIWKNQNGSKPPTRIWSQQIVAERGATSPRSSIKYQRLKKQL